MVKKNIFNLINIFIFFILVFSRSFTGLLIFNFRLGELIIGFSILSTFIIFITYKKNKSDNTLNQIINFYLILVILFLLNLIFSSGNLFNLYTFKSSSYVWTFIFLIFGYLYASYFELISFRLILFFSTLIIYVLNTIIYPEFLKDFFINYSDKFDYLKASDITICLIISLLFIKQQSSKNTYYLIFSIFIGLFLPLLLLMSKGSLLAFLFFIIYEIFISRKYLKSILIKLVGYTFLTLILFIVSTLNVWGDLTFTKSSETRFENFSNEEFVSKLNEVIDNKINFEHPDKLLYFLEGRLYSNDITANWRLQIWQDIFYDLESNNLMLTGYGYGAIIPAMDDIERRGTDGTNENVHNYFVNIIARGGLIHFIFFIFFYIYIFKISFSKSQSKLMFTYITSVLIISFFDSSMESVRFPLIYYFFMGIFLSRKFYDNYLSS